MKKLIHPIIALLVLSATVSAQAPQSFKYQAVARDASGEVIANQQVSFQIIILQSSESGTAVYTETHADSTNQFGLVTLEIGTGTTIDDFSGIDWGNDAYFIQVEMDITGGTSYSLMGTSQLLSVPYALYANKSGDGFSGNYDDLTSKPDLFNGTWLSLTGKPTGNSTGDLQYWNGTSWVIVPAGTTGQKLTMNVNSIPVWENSSTPTSTALAATNVLMNTATLNGSVNANGFSTTVSIEYGLTTSYGSLIMEADGSPVTENIDKNVTSDISGLSANTEYHFRLKTSNAVGVTYSSDMSFTTLGDAPRAISLPSTGITSISVTLNGCVNANGYSTTVVFEYGLNTGYGNSATAAPSPIDGNTDTEVSASIIGLTLGTTYHYRIKTTNSLGTTYSNDMAFTAAYAIGENVNGGFVFYIDGTGLHGLVCAPTDQSAGTIWGCLGTLLTGADGTTVGTGNQNTIDIVNGCTTAGIAAKICYDLVLNGYDDWFLPSIDELGLMYTNLYQNPLGHLGDFNGTIYYSSSEYSSDWAWFYNFANYLHPRCNGGALGEGANKDGYDGAAYRPSSVRAVRAF